MWAFALFSRCLAVDSLRFPSGLAEEAVPKSTILAVDDVRTNLDLYARVLKRLPGLRVVSYTSSSAALGWCRKNDFDLLLIDYRMPEPNGLQFVEQLRKLPDRDVPIIMITAVDEKDVRREAAALGVDDFLVKPTDALEFLRASLRCATSTTR